MNIYLSYVSFLQYYHQVEVAGSSLPPPPPPLSNHNSPPALVHDRRRHPATTIIVGPAAASLPTVQYYYYGRLRYRDEQLFISTHKTDIGRNSSTSSVHFSVGKNSFVSRKHLQLIHNNEKNAFFLMCLSKNGVFVDDVFQRKSAEPLKLPKTWVSNNIYIYTEQKFKIVYIFISTLFSCTFRFPSTNIKISFESYLDHPLEQPAKNNKTVENSNVIYEPLKITIPGHDKKSPFPSPTGTISAANSCPTSPRHNYQDYHHHLNASNYASYNHHNNNHLSSSSSNVNHGNNHNFEHVSHEPDRTLLST